MIRPLPLVILLLTWCGRLAVTVNAQTIQINSPVTGPYERPSVIDTASLATSTLTFTSPTEIAGTLIWAQSPFTGPMFTVSDVDAAAGNYDITLPLVIPHSLDDPLACSPLQHMVNDEGQPLAGAIVLVRRGSCVFANKGLNVMATGARAIAIYNSPGHTGLVRIGLANNETIVSMFLTLNDGTLLKNYLQGRRDWLANVASNPSYPMPAGHNYTLPAMGTVVGTGKLNANEMAALTTIAQSMTITVTVSDSSALRDWSDILANPSLDPCLNRLVGIYCERGSVQSIYFKNFNILGTFSPAWGSLTSLKYFTLDENAAPGLTGPVPPEFCQCTQLRSIQIEANSLTSLPNCLGTSLTQLQVLLVERNTFTNLPTDVSGLTSLVWFTASQNQITTLPATITTWTKIGLFDVSTNPKLAIDASTLTFSSWSQVYQINLANSALTGGFQPTAFNGLTTLINLDVHNNLLTSLDPTTFNSLSSLVTLDFSHNLLTGSVPAFTSNPLNSLDMSYNSFSGNLSLSSNLATTLNNLNLGHNSLSGQLPSFNGFSSLATLNLQSNQFTGDLPTTWSTMTSLTTLTMDVNQLTGPLHTLQSMTALTKAHFENNSLVVPSSMAGDVGQMIDGMVGSSLTELYLDYNSLGPKWGNGWLTQSSIFAKLSMSHNRLTVFPPNIWNTYLTSIDFSYNQIVDTVPDGLNSDSSKAYVTSFNIDGNPGASVATIGGALPTWLTPVVPVASFTSSDTYYSCPVLGSPTYAFFRFTYIPSATSYFGCGCAKGRFGTPPNCDIVPVEAKISPYNHVTSNETTLQATNSSLFNSILVDHDTLPNGVINSSIITADDSNVLPPTFEDSWYGTDRLTVGLNTYFTVDLSNIRRQSNRTESNNFPSVNASYIAPTDPNQPVRTITIRLHISATYFTGIQNVIVVQQGTHASPGDLVTTLTGSGFSQKYTQSNSSFTRSPEYQARYGAKLATLSDPRLVELQVIGNSAITSFSSRDSDKAHFVATYSYGFGCPAGTELRGLSYPKFSANDVYTCEPLLQSYDLKGVRIGVQAVVALALAFIVLNFIVLGIKWNSPIYRASSRLFVSMILLFLAILAVGALLYAMDATTTGVDSLGVCLARGWLSAMPIAGILAVLLVKTWRLYKIFCSTKIMKVTNASDGDLLKTIGVICALEAALLIVWSVMKLSKPEADTYLVDNNAPKYLVYKCSQEDGFVPWIITQLAVIFIGMAASTWLSFKTRHIPTAFNESSHIGAAYYLLILTYVIIVPLDFINQDKPESGVILQGLVQAFVAFALTAMLLGPKMYIAIMYSDKDQTAMTKEILSGPQSNASTTRGSVANPNANASSSGLNAGRGSVTPVKTAAPTPAAGDRGSIAGKAAPIPLTANGKSSGAASGGDRGSVTGSAVPRFGTKAAPISDKTDKPKSTAAPFRPSFLANKSANGSSAAPTNGTPQSSSMPAKEPVAGVEMTPINVGVTTPSAPVQMSPVNLEAGAAGPEIPLLLSVTPLQYNNTSDQPPAYTPSSSSPPASPLINTTPVMLHNISVTIPTPAPAQTISTPVLVPVSQPVPAPAPYPAQLPAQVPVQTPVVQQTPPTSSRPTPAFERTQTIPIQFRMSPASPRNQGTSSSVMPAPITSSTGSPPPMTRVTTAFGAGGSVPSFQLQHARTPSSPKNVSAPAPFTRSMTLPMGGAAAPSSTTSGSGDSALDFVKRLRNRLPASRGAAPTSPSGSSSQQVMPIPSATAPQQ